MAIKPRVEFWADKYDIFRGEAVRLQWEVSSDSWGAQLTDFGEVPLVGAQRVYPVDSLTKYILTAGNEAGRTNKEVVIRVYTPTEEPIIPEEPTEPEEPPAYRDVEPDPWTDPIGWAIWFFITSMFKTVGLTISTFLTLIWKIQQFLASGYQAINDFLRDPISKISTWMAGVFVKVTDLISSVTSEISNWWSQATARTLGWIVSAVEKAYWWVARGWSNIWDWWSNIRANIGNWWSTSIEHLNNTFKDFIGGIGWTWTTVLGRIKNTLDSTVGPMIEAVFESLFQGIKDGLDEILGNEEK